MEKKYTAKVNENYTFELTELILEELDILRRSDTAFHVISDKKNHEVVLENADFLKKTYQLQVNNTRYTVTLMDDLDQLIKSMGFSTGSGKKLNEIKAPMPGIILSVSASVGQEVKEGETLLILEAMKMENAIGAPRDGIIKEVNVSQGGTVEKGALMISLE
jgi:biotin carboxyl carrier protein